MQHHDQSGYDQIILDYLRDGSEPASTYTISPISALITERDSAVPAGASFDFNGRFADNSLIVQSEVFDGDLSTSHLVSFLGFHGVKYMDWSQEHQVDAICVRAACDDGLDDDADGLTDLEDPECLAGGYLNERFVLAPPSTPSPPSVPSLAPGMTVLLIAGLVGVCAIRPGRPRPTLIRSKTHAEYDRVQPLKFRQADRCPVRDMPRLPAGGGWKVAGE